MGKTTRDKKDPTKSYHLRAGEFYYAGKDFAESYKTTITGYERNLVRKKSWKGRGRKYRGWWVVDTPIHKTVKVSEKVSDRYSEDYADAKQYKDLSKAIKVGKTLNVKYKDLGEFKIYDEGGNLVRIRKAEREDS